MCAGRGDVAGIGVGGETRWDSCVEGRAPAVCGGLQGMRPRDRLVLRVLTRATGWMEPAATGAETRRSGKGKFAK